MTLACGSLDLGRVLFESFVSLCFSILCYFGDLIIKYFMSYVKILICKTLRKLSSELVLVISQFGMHFMGIKFGELQVPQRSSMKAQ